MSTANPTAIDPVCGMTVDPATAAGAFDLSRRRPIISAVRIASKNSRPIHRNTYPASRSRCPRLAGPPRPEQSGNISARWTRRCSATGPVRAPNAAWPWNRRTLPAEDEADPEQAKMVRLFWIALAASVPVLVLSMGLDATLQLPAWNGITQALLTTLVVVYCGGTFYQRAWTAIVQGRFNMFTLIVLGVSTAYFYSLLALLSPGLFPVSIQHHGQHRVIFRVGGDDHRAGAAGPGAGRPSPASDDGRGAQARRSRAEIGPARAARRQGARLAARVDPARRPGADSARRKNPGRWRRELKARVPSMNRC